MTNLNNTILLILAIYYVNAIVVYCYVASDSKSDGLNSLELADHLKRGELQILDATMELSRTKRFISVGNFQPDKKYQACEAPGGGPGFCRHLHHCIIDEMRNNFMKFMSYLCRIENMYVGICCPEQNTTLNIQENSIQLPTTDISSNQLEVNVSSRINEEAVNPESIGCGVNAKSRPRIIGGRPADPQDWPWMAALLRNKISHFCGGVLITDRHVLTAAHCTNNFKAHEIRVRLGEYDFRRTDESNSRDFRVVDIKQHARFHAPTYLNDIAILKLHTSTSFNSDIWPICLPPPNEDFVNKYAIVTGWGTQGYAQPISDVLMEVDVPIWSHSQCESTYDTVIPNTAICAGGYKGGKDSCQGDSGGPLMHKASNQRWITVGIVSFGIRCGENNHPGIYTKVNKYLPWIVENSVF